MVLPEALQKEIEEVRNLLIPKQLWKTFDGDDYDVWALKVSNLLKLQDLWHFIFEEDSRDPDSFKALIQFQNERKQVVALCLIKYSIDYSLIHYIVEAYTPKITLNILKEVFSEEPIVEEGDFVSHAKHQESHSEVEDNQEDYVYVATNVEPVMFDIENKHVNVVVLSDVSNSISE